MYRVQVNACPNARHLPACKENELFKYSLHLASQNSLIQTKPSAIEGEYKRKQSEIIQIDPKILMQLQTGYNGKLDARHIVIIADLILSPPFDNIPSGHVLVHSLNCYRIY